MAQRGMPVAAAGKAAGLFAARGRWIAVCALVLLLQALLTLSHEPWYDEWQALQIALGSPNLPALLENLRYEGHPPLWYLILQGTALVVPTAFVLPGVQLVIALAAQALILFRVALPRMERLAFALSYVMLIEVGSLARSLSFGALMMIVAMTTRSRASRWTAIALLPMAGFQFGLMSLALLWLFRGERPLWRPGVALWLAASLLAAWSVIPAADMVPAQPPRGLALDFLRTSAVLAPQLLPLHLEGGRFEWGGIPPAYIAVFLGPLFVLMADRILAQAPRERIAFIGFALACILFSIFVYRLGVRHFAMLPLFLVLLRARATARDGWIDMVAIRLWRGWLVLGVAGGLLGAFLSLTQPFDASRAAATLLQRQGLADKPIVVWPEVSTQGIAVHLRREFTSLDTGCTMSFHRWNRPPASDEPPILFARLAERAKQWGRFSFLTEFDMDVGQSPVPIRRLGEVAAGYDGYRFHLFEVGHERPGLAVPTNPCAPHRLSIRNWWRE